MKLMMDLKGIFQTGIDKQNEGAIRYPHSIVKSILIASPIYISSLLTIES